MEEEIKLTANAILDKKFTKDVKGYNPDEVDEFLDCVISDYKAFVEYVNKANAYQANLLEKIRLLEDENQRLANDNNKKVEQMRSLEAENASWSDRLSHIGPSDHVTEENLEYINKINIYEEFLHSKGVNPDAVIRAAKKQQ
ncbi:MAG: DivIVA domain-containing protein [Bacilli bacterium]|nr:DivIVA domain-containing protein [Bacilli bacterium]